MVGPSDGARPLGMQACDLTVEACFTPVGKLAVKLVPSLSHRNIRMGGEITLEIVGHKLVPVPRSHGPLGRSAARQPCGAKRKDNNHEGASQETIAALRTLVRHRFHAYFR